MTVHAHTRTERIHEFCRLQLERRLSCSFRICYKNAKTSRETLLGDGVKDNCRYAAHIWTRQQSSSADSSACPVLTVEADSVQVRQSQTLYTQRVSFHSWISTGRFVFISCTDSVLSRNCRTSGSGSATASLQVDLSCHLLKKRKEYLLNYVKPEYCFCLAAKPLRS